jgi:hypothetical protein
VSRRLATPAGIYALVMAGDDETLVERLAEIGITLCEDNAALRAVISRLLKQVYEMDQRIDRQRDLIAELRGRLRGEQSEDAA